MMPGSRAGENASSQSGSMPDPGEPNPALDYLKLLDPDLRIVGDWMIVCLGGGRGVVKQPGHCRLEKYDFTAVARVDEAGMQIRTARARGAPCERVAHHAAVDGKPIQGLSLKEQVRALSTGYVFAREVQSPSPDCTISVEETQLVDFAPAYEVLEERWAVFRRGLEH